MAKSRVTFDDVREIGLAMPGVEEGTSYGTPALKADGKLLVRLKEDPDLLVVRVDYPEREDLMASDPQTYFVTDHYVPHPWVLVRLSRLTRDVLRDLLTMARRFEPQRGRAGRRGRPRRPA